MYALPEVQEIAPGEELKAHQVAVVLTFLGWVRSVNMLKGLKGDVFEGGGLRMSKEEFLRRTQSADLVGRAIAMLAADSAVMKKSGKTFSSAILHASTGSQMSMGGSRLSKT